MNDQTSKRRQRAVKAGQVAAAITWSMELWPAWRDARTPEDFQKILEAMEGHYRYRCGKLEGAGEEVPQHVRIVASAELAFNDTGMQMSSAVRRIHLTAVYDPSLRNMHFTEIDMGSLELGHYADHIPRVKRLVNIEDNTQINEVVYDYRGGMNTREHQLYFDLGIAKKWRQTHSTFPRTMRHFSFGEDGSVPTLRRTFWNELHHAFDKVRDQFAPHNAATIERLATGRADIYTQYRHGEFTVEERRFIMDHYVKLNHVIFRNRNKHPQFHEEVVSMLIELANIAPPMADLRNSRPVLLGID